jgi:hypothetical protein
MSILVTVTSSEAWSKQTSGGNSAAGLMQIANYSTYIADAARRFGLPQMLIVSVIAAESNGDPGAVSPKGAMGLMQLMPKTFADMAAVFNLGSDPFDPSDNIIAGTGYLRLMFDRYGEDGFLAAYNAGPARYEAHLDSGAALPRETIDYVSGISSKVVTPTVFVQSESHVDSRPWSTAPLFVPHADAIKSDAATPDNAGTTSRDGISETRPNLQADSLFPALVASR